MGKKTFPTLEKNYIFIMLYRVLSKLSAFCVVDAHKINFSEKYLPSSGKCQVIHSTLRHINIVTYILKRSLNLQYYFSGIMILI